MGHQWFALSVVASVVGFSVVAASPAAAQSDALQTPWGDPDLGGVWDFSTITPLQRPEELGDKAFLTPEEAAQANQEVVERDQRLLARERERTTAGGNVDRRDDGTAGFYNNFWLDAGSKTLSNLRTSQITDPKNGRLPALTASAQKRAAERRAYLAEHPADSWEDRNVSDRCILGFNAGPPISPGFYNQNLQIVQTPDHVALMTEMVHTVRIVPLDGRDALADGIRQWSGDSRGHWEGDTLVVTTTNFNGKGRSIQPWNNVTDSMTLVERITRVDADTLEYAYTMSDPRTWATSWSASLPFQRTDQPLYEYACHEGNYAMANILAGARTAERDAAK